MLRRLRTVVARTLSEEKALKFALLGTAIAFLVFMGSNVVAGLLIGWPEGPVDRESFLLGLVVWAMLFVLPIGFIALRGAWVAQRAVGTTMREESNLRALRADPKSAYGLPGFPEAGAGTGDLTSVDTGGLTAPGPEETRGTEE
jgi:hypothetical protein